MVLNGLKETVFCFSKHYINCLNITKQELDRKHVTKLEVYGQSFKTHTRKGAEFENLNTDKPPSPTLTK